MNFLAPLFLYGLAAATIPIIIHLLNRRRFRTVKWAAMQFLLKASQESRGKKRLRHILILICRALAIATLIFGMSRLQLSGLTNFGSSSVDTVVLILDRSASMELREGDAQPSLRQDLVKKVSESFKDLNAGRLILLDSATGEAQSVPSPESLHLLSATAPTSTQADIPGLVRTAIDYLNDTNAGTAEIWIASDLQLPDWKPDDTRWTSIRAGLSTLPEEPRLRILTSPKADTENFSLELLFSRRIDDELLLDLKLSRITGTTDASLSLTTQLNEARTGERITLRGQEMQFQKRLPINNPDEPGYGWLSLATDNNPQDNDVFFAFGPKEPVHTYLVTSETDESVEAIQKAAAPPGYALQECHILQPTEAHRIDWSQASLVIWYAPIPSGSNASELVEFIRSGGAVLFLPTAEPSENSILGISWGNLENASDKEYFIAGTSLRDDGPWRDGIDGTPMPLKKIVAIKRRTLVGEGAPLAEWDDNAPMLLRKIEGSGTAIFLNTLPNYQWSNLEQTGLHLVALQRLIEKGTDRLNSGSRAIAGSEKTKPRNDEVRERLDTASEHDPANADHLTGIYRLGERLLAVNRPATESSPEKIDNLMLEELFKDTRYSLFEEKTGSNSLVTKTWRAFLIAMILFLIAEALLCLQPKKSIDLKAIKKEPTS